MSTISRPITRKSDGPQTVGPTPSAFLCLNERYLEYTDGRIDTYDAAAYRFWVQSPFSEAAAFLRAESMGLVLDAKRRNGIVAATDSLLCEAAR